MQALARAEEARNERLQDFENKLNAADERVANQLAQNASNLAAKNANSSPPGGSAFVASRLVLHE